MSDPKVEIKKLLKAALYKSDGTKTSFAKKKGINEYEDFYDFFKNMKENFKEDRESTAFSDIIELAKSVVGRFSAGLGEFGAFVYVLRTIGTILDDLKRLSSVIKELQDEYVEESLQLKEAEVLLMEAGIFDEVTNTARNISNKLKINFGSLMGSIKQYFSRIFRGNATENVQKVANNIKQLPTNTQQQKVAKNLIDSLMARAKDLLNNAKANKKKYAVGVLLVAVAASIIRHVFRKDPLQDQGNNQTNDEEI